MIPRLPVHAARSLLFTARSRCSSLPKPSTARHSLSLPLRPPGRGSRNASTGSTASPKSVGPSSNSSGARIIVLIAGTGLLTFALGISHARSSFLYDVSSSLSYEADPESSQDGRDPNLPRFRIAEVKQHDGKSPNPWVMYGDKVYDITDWISAHPGGQIILRAAGGSIEPYWNIFSIHKNQYVYDILNQYLIGYIHIDDLVDGKPAQESIEDPFADDPIRHPALITRTATPRNAETPGTAISSSFLTPNELFYVRNHMWVPNMTYKEAEQHVLTIELLDGSTKDYTLHDLKTKFPKRQVTAVLQCSGNRRGHMTKGSGRSTNGLQWTAGAISNASWEGVYLADVLADAGFDLLTAMNGTSDVQHVHFAGLEAYAASIPIKKAVDPMGDVLLAYGMNGKTLPRDHGYPLRSIVPGNVAARSVKWLNYITLSDEESTSQWQRKDYKCFGPNQTKVDWDTAPSIQELPVQSAITDLQLGGWTKPSSDTSTNAPAKELVMSGYAYSGGGRAIIRVDVSLDNGKTWAQADLLPDDVSTDGVSSPRQGHGSWSWKRWRFDGLIPRSVFTEAEEKGDAPSSRAKNNNTIDRVEDSQARTMAPAAHERSERRCTTVLVKATDEVYNTQPESHAATWNVRGNLATAWDRMQVCQECRGGEDAS